MIHEDYLMRMIMQLITAIRRVYHNPTDLDDFRDDVEQAVGEAVNIDPELFFSLSPESQVQMLEMGDTDPKLAKYITNAIFYESKVMEANGDIATSQLRRSQGIAIAKKYGCDIPSEDISAEGLVQLFLKDPEGLEDEDAEEALREKQAKEEREAAERNAKQGFSISGIPLDKLKLDL